ncbi:DUF2157 domain-containing protein [Oryzifoliimicrobium ureilyticus]|uniref:DUF2157 domain-containing protein n=1 Tax=Oryzifoliimicrobium ureilyticus TaxID=3113724 RepID=UPI003076082C
MYRSRLQKDLSLWVEQGLLPDATAKALLSEYDARQSSFSLGKVLAILAAVLIGVAVIILIAANWEAIPRPMRLIGIVAVLWAAHLGAALFLARGAAITGNAMLVFGAISFGGAISLVGQMYHLSGDQQTVMYVWFSLCAISAVLFRSAAVTGVAAVVAWGSFATYLDLIGAEWSGLDSWATPALATALIVLIRWSDAGPVRHLAYLLFVAWFAWLYTVFDSETVAIVYCVVGIAMLVAISLTPIRHSSLLRPAGIAPAFYAFLFALLGFLFLHDSFSSGTISSVVLAVLVLAAAILAIVLQGRDNGAVRWLAYAAFAGETLYLAERTVGSMLGTSGLFLAMGLFVAALAYAVVRAEKLLAGKRRVSS